MITGNFCLLTGVSPDEVDNWYLGIYIDGIEWAELPNTRGMSQYADGGMVASKPYSASGNYISKMSDYCKNCRYKAKEVTTEEACPFNSLYWRFLEANKDKLAKNPRNALVYSSWYRKKEDERKAILIKADGLVENIERL
jgi:deoxyribodipyrimidine photolyase-related protein